MPTAFLYSGNLKEISMIKIKYSLGNKNRIEIKGHAGFDQKGRDIVCAGVSAIFYALCGKLENQDGAEYTYRDKAGEAYAECRGERDAFDMAVIGFMQIELAYPENVCVAKR